MKTLLNMIKFTSELSCDPFTLIHFEKLKTETFVNFALMLERRSPIGAGLAVVVIKLA